MEIRKIALSTILAGTLAIATIDGLRHFGKTNQHSGWNRPRISQMENMLQVPHKLVREAEMYSNRGYGSLAPVYATINNNLTRINFEFTDDNGQAVAFYKDGKMIKAVYFDKEGKRLTIKKDNEGRLAYVSRDESHLENIE